MRKAGSEAGHFIYLCDCPYTSFEGKKCPFHGNCTQQTFTCVNCGLGEVLLPKKGSLNSIFYMSLDKCHLTS